MSTKTVTIPMLEEIQFTPESKVDRENCCVHNVRVLGFESKNKRRYTKKSVQESLPRYERIALMTDHPASEAEAKKQRSVMSQFGFLEGLFDDDGGSRAKKAQLYPNHPYSKVFLDKAEMNPGAVCLSHNADATGYYDSDGTFVIESIPTVRSVDVVHRGGTTTSIFEGEKPVTLSLRDHLKQSPLKGSKFVQLLLEMDSAMLDAPVASPPPGAAPEGEEGGPKDWKKCLTEAIATLTTSDDAEAHDLAKKILALMHPGRAAEADDNPFPEKDDEPEEKEETEEEVKESVRDLCELASLQPSRAVLEGICAIPDKSKRLNFIKTLKAEKGSNPRKETPTSTGPTVTKPVKESADDKSTETKKHEFPTGKTFQEALSQEVYTR